MEPQAIRTKEEMNIKQVWQSAKVKSIEENYFSNQQSMGGFLNVFAVTENALKTESHLYQQNLRNNSTKISTLLSTKNQ